MAKESWRKTILDVVLDQGGEVSADSLHEGAETEDDLQEAIDAADQLVKDGLLVESKDVYTEAPGMHEAVKEARAAYGR